MRVCHNRRHKRWHVSVCVSVSVRRFVPFYGKIIIFFSCGLFYDTQKTCRKLKKRQKKCARENWNTRYTMVCLVSYALCLVCVCAKHSSVVEYVEYRERYT